ncbi:MBL fold metallo-hydrolase [Viscerimonas tarda]
MKLIYLFHSGFVIEANGCIVILDYYRDANKVVHDIIAQYTGKIYVLSSHSHPDHFSAEILSWKKKNSRVQYIFSNDILDAGLVAKDAAVYLAKSETYSDNLLYIKAFGSTDLGVSFLINLEGKAIFHAGDLNNWHWNEESTAGEIREAESFYLDELSALTNEIKQLDLAMFPVDPRLGKDYTKGAEQFVQALKVDLFAPMHFGEEYQKANAFKTQAEEEGCAFFEITAKGQSVDF